MRSIKISLNWSYLNLFGNLLINWLNLKLPFIIGLKNLNNLKNWLNLKLLSNIPIANYHKLHLFGEKSY